MTSENFDEVQRRLQARRAGSDDRSRLRVSTGAVRCASCGSGLVVVRNASDRRYYRCVRAMKGEVIEAACRAVVRARTRRLRFHQQCHLWRKLCNPTNAMRQASRRWTASRRSTPAPPLSKRISLLWKRRSMPVCAKRPRTEFHWLGTLTSTGISRVASNWTVRG